MNHAAIGFEIIWMLVPHRPTIVAGEIPAGRQQLMNVRCEAERIDVERLGCLVDGQEGRPVPRAHQQLAGTLFGLYAEGRPWPLLERCLS